ncbi:MAG: LL-diaminopimelate aminotransferase [Deltaproteobacteria bacterium]|nr:LL-diaminopimelate aminotransferase [Deltaproteobacteria bacterium]
MKNKLAQRIRDLPPYLFARIDELKSEQRARGVDLIDLGIGDPDLPTPPNVVAALQEAAANPAHHRYPSYSGMLEFRKAAVDFCARRFGLDLDPATEALALIGSKEGIAHFPVAFVDPGDLVLVPDPGYPVYGTGTKFCGGEVHVMPLRRENGFLPDLSAIPKDVAERAKVMWINYPNNPTAALAPRSFYENVVAFAKEHDVIVASDVAYSEMYYDDERPMSFLEVPGAKDVGIEFHSLSKTYNMTGWRVGFAVGNRDLISGLGKVKTNVDSGVFEAVQRAATEALAGDQSSVEDMRRIYRERRDVLCKGLMSLGHEVLAPKATFYCLVAVPKGYSSLEFAAKLLTEAGIVATPATGFGAWGEGYVRLTLCADKSRLAEVVERLKRC